MERTCRSRDRPGSVARLGRRANCSCRAKGEGPSRRFSRWYSAAKYRASPARETLRRTLDFPNESHHHAEDLERALGPNDRIGLVLGPQDECAVLDVEPFQRELAVDDCDDDIALLRSRAFLDDDQVAFENAGVHHRIASDAYEHRLRRPLD